MEKNLTIRNSIAEFLIFQAHDKSRGVEVVCHDETIRATRSASSAPVSFANSPSVGTSKRA